ncbi:MAG: YdcF family protein [Peptococcaceae bacterium]|nr:YdcF family protein [Peptococcaceae bacterium]
MNEEKKKRSVASSGTVLVRRGLGLVGVACLLYFLGLSLYLASGNTFIYIWLILGLAFFGLSAAWPALAALPRRGKYLLAAAAVIGLAAFIWVEGLIIAAALGQAAPGADYLIVLGAKVNGQIPSKTLQQRIDSAALYLQEDQKTLAVVSGGQGQDEDISEARAMAQGLQAWGIGPERILLEEQSTSTEENLRFSQALIPPGSQVVIVSSDFHLYRAQALARGLGYSDVSGLPAPSLPGLLPNYCLREFCAVISTWVFGRTG